MNINYPGGIHMMVRECGNAGFPIWLLGDSEPKNWRKQLCKPLDVRHPIRHNIWTSILDVVQDEIHRKLRKRLDTKDIYIRNAIDDPAIKPKNNQKIWNADVEYELNNFKLLINKHKPVIIVSFGSFAYEFGRRATGSTDFKEFRYWSTLELGDEFRERINSFNIDNTNLLPLLHRSIAGRFFLQSHNNFCRNFGANYFNYVGEEIADVIVRNKNNLNIWI